MVKVIRIMYMSVCYMSPIHSYLVMCRGTPPIHSGMNQIEPAVRYCVHTSTSVVVVAVIILFSVKYDG